MGIDTSKYTVQNPFRFVRRMVILASAAAICASCSSDDDVVKEQPGAGGVAGGGAAGAATGGGTATGGTTSASSYGAGGSTAGGASFVAGSPNAGGTTGTAGSPGIAGGGAGGSAGAPQTTQMELYVACADTTGSIMHLALDSASGAVTPINTYSTGVSNSWATLNAAQNRMYMSSRTQGRITTLSRDPATGALTVLGNVAVPMAPEGGGGTAGAAGAAGMGNTPTGNPATQTLFLDGTEKFLLAANYSANYVYVYNLAANGAVGSMAASKLDGVSSHQTLFAPGTNNRYVLVPYRGSDTIVTYEFNATSGALSLVRTYQSDADATAATTGPRHVVFHPVNNTWVYAINEVAGSLSMLKFNNTTGELTHQQSVSSVPATYTAPEKFASEIAIAPAGNFVYVSNRYSTAATFTTEGSLGVFAVDATTGQLSAVEFQSSRGALPRHFELSKDGSVLVVGNQNSNNIAVFSVNKTTGVLTHRVTRNVCTTPFFVKILGK